MDLLTCEYAVQNAANCASVGYNNTPVLFGIKSVYRLIAWRDIAIPILNVSMANVSASASLRLGLVHLTPTERAIFDCLYAGLNNWFNMRREVKDVALGIGHTDKAMHMHVSRLRHKLESTPFRIETGVYIIRMVCNESP